jgi:hypothetical protein
VVTLKTVEVHAAVQVPLTTQLDQLEQAAPVVGV